VILVHGSPAHAEALWEEVAQVLAPMGLRLSPTKTRTCHIDEGFDFLGFRIQRRTKKGTGHKHVYTYPSKKALASITGKIRTLTNRARSATLEDLLRQVNPVIRGWCSYFRHGVSKATFRYLDDFVWSRVTRWLRKRHRGVNWRDLRRRYLVGYPGQRPSAAGVELFLAQQVEVTRYRWRGSRIPTPWAGIRVEQPV
jgi:RNA-directed DNA polymerase